MDVDADPAEGPCGPSYGCGAMGCVDADCANDRARVGAGGKEVVKRELEEEVRNWEVDKGVFQFILDGTELSSSVGKRDLMGKRHSP